MYFIFACEAVRFYPHFSFFKKSWVFMHIDLRDILNLCPIFICIGLKDLVEISRVLEHFRN